MDKGLKKELKKILTNRVIVGDDGVLRALSEGQPLIYHGAADGWEAVRLHGIAHRAVRFRIRTEGEPVFETVFAAVQKLGRLVELSQSPETLACIRRYVLNRPVVIAVDYEGEGVVRVTVYTGKSLFSGLSCRRGLRDFCRAFPPGKLDPREMEAVREKKDRKQKKKDKKAKQDTPT